MADEEEVFDMQPVVSTRVVSIGYDKDSKKLRAEFPSGKTAEYSNVSEETFQSVMSSPSIGSAFGNLIVNGGYPFKYV